AGRRGAVAKVAERSSAPRRPGPATVAAQRARTGTTTPGAPKAAAAKGTGAPKAAAAKGTPGAPKAAAAKGTGAPKAAAARATRPERAGH
ncbi:MAG: hypothetical protein M0029_02745, partial [Actinomycetota bacterium]|nr:hypothetical protein [Actinomycetota bacterium]